MSTYKKSKRMAFTAVLLVALLSRSTTALNNGGNSSPNWKSQATRSFYKEDKIKMDILSLYKGKNATAFEVVGDQSGQALIIKSWDKDSVTTFDIAKDTGLGISVKDCTNLINLRNGDLATLCDQRFLVFLSVRDKVTITSYIDLQQGHEESGVTCSNISTSKIYKSIYSVCVIGKQVTPNSPLIVSLIDIETRRVLKQAFVNPSASQSIGLPPYRVTSAKIDDNFQSVQILSNDIQSKNAFNVVFNTEEQSSSVTFIDLKTVSDYPQEGIVSIENDSFMLYAFSSRTISGSNRRDLSVTSCYPLTTGPLRCSKEISLGVIPESSSLFIKTQYDLERIDETEVTISSNKFIIHGIITPFISQDFKIILPLTEFTSKMSKIHGILINRGTIHTIGEDNRQEIIISQMETHQDSSRIETTAENLVSPGQKATLAPSIAVEDDIRNPNQVMLLALKGTKVKRGAVRRAAVSVLPSKQESGEFSFKVRAIKSTGETEDSMPYRFDILGDFSETRMNISNRATAGFFGDNLSIGSFSEDFGGNGMKITVESDDESIKSEAFYAEEIDVSFTEELETLVFTSIVPIGNGIFALAPENGNSSKQDQFTLLNCTRPDNRTISHTCSKQFEFGIEGMEKDYKLAGSMSIKDTVAVFVKGKSNDGQPLAALVAFNNPILGSREEISWEKNVILNAFVFRFDYIYNLMVSKSEETGQYVYDLSLITNYKRNININNMTIDLETVSRKICPVDISFNGRNFKVVILSKCKQNYFLFVLKFKDIYELSKGMLIESSKEIRGFNSPKICVTENYVSIYDQDPTKGNNYLSTFEVSLSPRVEYVTPLASLLGSRGIIQDVCDRDSGNLYILTNDETDQKLVTFKLEEIARSPLKRVHSALQFEFFDVDQIIPNLGRNREGENFILLARNRALVPKIAYLSLFAPVIKLDASEVTQEKELNLRVTATSLEGKNQSQVIRVNLENSLRSLRVKVNKTKGKVNVKELKNTTYYLKNALKFYGYVSGVSYNSKYDTKKENLITNKRYRKIDESDLRGESNRWENHQNSIIEKSNPKITRKINNKSTNREERRPNYPQEKDQKIDKEIKILQSSKTHQKARSIMKGVMEMKQVNRLRWGDAFDFDLEFIEVEIIDPLTLLMISSGAVNNIQSPQIVFNVQGHLDIRKSKFRLTYHQTIMGYSMKIFKGESNTMVTHVILKNSNKIHITMVDFEVNEDALEMIILKKKEEYLDPLGNSTSRIQGTSPLGIYKETMMKCTVELDASKQLASLCSLTTQGVHSFLVRIGLNGLESEGDLVKSSKIEGTYRNLEGYIPIKSSHHIKKLATIAKWSPYSSKNKRLLGQDYLLIFYNFVEGNSSPNAIVPGSEIDLRPGGKLSNGISVFNLYTIYRSEINEAFVNCSVSFSMDDLSFDHKIEFSPLRMMINNPKVVSPEQDSLVFTSIGGQNPIEVKLNNLIQNDDDPAKKLNGPFFLRFLVVLAVNGVLIGVWCLVNKKKHGGTEGEHDEGAYESLGKNENLGTAEGEGSLRTAQDNDI